MGAKKSASASSAPAPSRKSGKAGKPDKPARKPQTVLNVTTEEVAKQEADDSAAGPPSSADAGAPQLDPGASEAEAEQQRVLDEETLGLRKTRPEHRVIHQAEDDDAPVVTMGKNPGHDPKKLPGRPGRETPPEPRVLNVTLPARIISAAERLQRSTGDVNVTVVRPKDAPKRVEYSPSLERCRQLFPAAAGVLTSILDDVIAAAPLVLGVGPVLGQAFALAVIDLVAILAERYAGGRQEATEADLEAVRERLGALVAEWMKEAGAKDAAPAIEILRGLVHLVAAALAPRSGAGLRVVLTQNGVDVLALAGV